MTEALAALTAETRDWFLLAGLVFLRIGAACALMPGFGERRVPARVRLIAALALSIVILPAVADRLGPLTGEGLPPLTWIVTETLSGLALGALFRLQIVALEVAGSIAAQSGSLAQMFPAAEEPMPAIAHLLVTAGLALAMASGAHVALAGVLIRSYDALPPGLLVPGDQMHAWWLGHLSQTFALAFSLALPFVIAGVAYNVILGAISRAMPQLMVAFVGAPAMAAGALLLAALAAGPALRLWMEGFKAMLGQPFGAAP